VPPFSVLNAGSSVWQKRKKIWMNKIKDTAQTRRNVTRTSRVQSAIDFMSIKDNTTSILDPVLCEILIHWFSEEGHHSFDPFAGDTSFGFVSAYKGRPFTGIELREEQVLHNQALIDANGLDAQYICDDALNVKKYIKKESMDFMFSCPPYADLEIYSDKENDLSNMDYDVLFDVIKQIFTDCFYCLKEERFAVIVVGEVRHRNTGCYIGLVPKIIQIMCDAGFHYYNELILNTPVGNLMFRAGIYMNHNRKIGKNHQNVLVFYKGNPKNIRKHFKEIKV
jgi:DNA modification methylase